MEKGVLKYGEYDGEQSEPIRVDRDRESQTRVKKHAEKAEKIRVSTLFTCSPAFFRAENSLISPRRGMCLQHDQEHIPV